MWNSCIVTMTGSGHNQSQMVGVTYPTGLCDCLHSLISQPTSGYTVLLQFRTVVGLPTNSPTISVEITENPFESPGTEHIRTGSSPSLRALCTACHTWNVES